MGTHTIQPLLEAACQRRMGETVRVTSAQALTAGASAATWKFDLESGEGARPMIAQLFNGGEQFGLALDKRTQGLVQQVAFEAGILTPRVEFILEQGDGLGEGFVTPFSQGETLGYRIVRNEELASARKVLAGQCGEILARVHSIDTTGLPALPDEEPAAMVRAQMATHDAFGQRVPTFELAFRWLLERCPAGARRCLVHGDFRNGNFIVDEKGMVAVLDWEMAHIGDAMEDLGWLCMNAWRFGVIDKPVGGFAAREDLYLAYEAASGQSVDPERVRFWEVFGTLKWGLICQWFAHQYTSGQSTEIERAAIGRRIAEVELDLLDLIEGVE